MKKVLLLIAITLLTNLNPCFALQNIELKQGSDYLYFSDSKIKSIKSNNPEIISAQRISTISDDEQQILFSAKKPEKLTYKYKQKKDL